MAKQTKIKKGDYVELKAGLSMRIKGRFVKGSFNKETGAYRILIKTDKGTSFFLGKRNHFSLEKVNAP